MKFSLIKIVLITIVIISFNACGNNPPQPFKYKIKNNNSTISEYQKQQLLNNVINRNSRLKYNYKNGCVSVGFFYGTSRYGMPLYKSFNNCYVIKNNEIKLIDKSWKKMYIAGEKGDDYTNFINKLNYKVKKEYPIEVENYMKFVKLYNKANNLRKEKLNKLKISIVDNTKVLPKSILKKLSKFKINLNKVKNKFNLYQSYVASNNNRFEKNIIAHSISKNFNKIFKDVSYISYKFKINISTKKNIIDRYKVKYKQNIFNNSYDKLPSNIVYEINKVYFDYMPKKFILSDKNIDVEIIANTNNYNNSWSINSVKIYNKTKEFIKIDTIAKYYGENVKDNIIEENYKEKIKIPPMSNKELTYEINNHNLYKLLLVKDKNQKIDYGFAINYKLINKNIVKNIYKINKYSIKDFK